MIHAIQGCCRIRNNTDKSAEYFPCRYWRRFIVKWIINNRTLIWKHKEASLRGQYGVEGGDLVPHPISLKEYCRLLLKRSTWGEDIVLHAVSGALKSAITVVNENTLHEYRIRHDRPLSAVDMVLVLTGGNHFVFAGKWTFTHFMDASTGRLYTY